MQHIYITAIQYYKIHLQHGEVIGKANVGGLIGYGYRQCTYNHSYQNAYLEITNSYAIGKVTATRRSRRISWTISKYI